MRTWLFDSHWILSDELFTKKAQFSLKPFLGNSYVTYSVRWSWQRSASWAPFLLKQGPDRIVRMEASNIPAFQTEDYMPPANELKSRVDFIYEEGISPRRTRPITGSRSGRSGTDNWKALSASARPWSRRSRKLSRRTTRRK